MMKRLISVFAILPCSAFLSGTPLDTSKISELYEKIVFESAAPWLSKTELSDLFARGSKNPEALFDISQNAVSELEPVRQGLKQLRLLASNQLSTLAPKILDLLDRKVKSLDAENRKHTIINEQRNRPILDVFTINAIRYRATSTSQNDNGQLLTVIEGAGRNLQLWNFKTQTKILDLPGYPYYIAHAKLLGDGLQIAASYREGTSPEYKFGIFDLQTQKFRTDLGAIAQSINTGDDWEGGGFWVSQDSHYLIGRNNQTKNFFVWDSTLNHSVELTDPNVHPVSNSNSDWRAARFLPNKLIVTIDPTHLHHWNPATGKLLNTIELPESIRQGSLGLAWPDSFVETRGEISQNGKYWLVALHDRTKMRSFVQWCLLDLETGQLIIAPTLNNSFRTVMLSPDSKSILTMNNDSIDIIDIASQNTTLSIPLGEYAAEDIAVSQNSRLLAFGTRNSSHRFIVLWDLERKTLMTEIGTQEAPASKPLFSSDGQFLITRGGRSENKVCVWLMETLF